MIFNSLQGKKKKNQGTDLNNEGEGTSGRGRANEEGKGGEYG
jgi:hypothetical protein